MCAKKYHLRRITTFTRYNANFYMFEYPISTPCNMQLIKYISICLSSILATNTALVVVFDVVKYIFKISPWIGDINMGNYVNALLNFLNALFASSFH